ncbi:MAG: hypothetical protein V3U13_03100 [Gemmatimonadota bacterium]
MKHPAEGGEIITARRVAAITDPSERRALLVYLLLGGDPKWLM